MTEPERNKMLSAARDAVLTALPDIWALYVYGSFARGDEWPDSDMDIGVLLPPGEQIPNLLSAMAEVSGTIKRDVDLVDLRRAGADLVHEVLKSGRSLYARDPDEVIGWEAEQMTDYAAFNPRRADVLSLYLRDPLLPHP